MHPSHPHPSLPHTQEDEEDEEVTPGYKTPKQVDLATIQVHGVCVCVWSGASMSALVVVAAFSSLPNQALDADDESLVKYKQQLLGQAAAVKG